MCKPYELVSGITKKSLQLSDGRSQNLHICPSAITLVFNASSIHELKMKKRKQCRKTAVFITKLFEI